MSSNELHFTTPFVFNPSREWEMLEKSPYLCQLVFQSCVSCRVVCLCNVRLLFSVHVSLCLLQWVDCGYVVADGHLLPAGRYLHDNGGDVDQWRATIGCFRASFQKNFSLGSSVTPFPMLFQILKLYWFCICFLAVSIVVLPLTLIIQFLAVHSLATQSCFLPLFASVHHFAKIVIYTTFELFKRIPLGIIRLVRYKQVAFKH